MKEDKEKTKDLFLPLCTPLLYPKKKSKKKKMPTTTDKRVRKKKFRIPTLEEVKEYAKNFDNLDFTPEYFFSYYDGCNWKIGHSRIRNWLSVFNVWAENCRRKEMAQQRRHCTRSTMPLGALERQQIVREAEIRRMEEEERKMAEMDRMRKADAEAHVSYEEFQQMKKEGRI